MRTSTDIGEARRGSTILVIVLTAKDLTEQDRRILSGRVEQIVSKGAHAHDQVVNLVQPLIDHHAP